MTPTEEQIQQAAHVIGIQKVASTQIIQRELYVSYYTARKILDELQKRGVVGPEEKNGKPRSILVQIKD